MIKVNLFDYNEEVNRIQLQKQAAAAIGVFLLVFTLVLIYGLNEYGQLNSLKEEARQLEDQKNAIQPQARKVMKMQKKIKRMDQIISGINTMRVNQIQPVKVLMDLNRKLPEDLWLRSITETTKRGIKDMGLAFKFEGGSDKIFEIQGSAFSSLSTTKYYDELKKIPYFETVFFYEVYQKAVMGIKVYEFIIFCHFIEEPEGKEKKKEK